MKRTLLLVTLLAIATVGAQAQATTPQTTNNQTTNNGTTTTRTQPNSEANLPYSSQANFNTMDATEVPQNIRTAFGSKYTGIVGDKWETDTRGYRNSFTQNGKQMSVMYDLEGNEREVRTGITVQDLPLGVRNSLEGKNANLPYEVKVGNMTYYSAQVDGKELYYDTKGKPVKYPKKK